MFVVLGEVESKEEGERCVWGLKECVLGCFGVCLGGRRGRKVC